MAQRRRVVTLALLGGAAVVGSFLLRTDGPRPSIVATGAPDGSASTSTSSSSTTGRPSAEPSSTTPASSMVTAPPTPSIPGPTSTSISTSTPTTVLAATIAVVPASDLPERSWVTVTGSGLGAARHAGTFQCPAGLRSHAEMQRCDGVWVNQIDLQTWILDGGLLEKTLRPVRRVLRDGTDCASPPGCELVLIDGAGGPALAAAALAFRGPAGPARPMAVRATPLEDLRDGDSITISARDLLADHPTSFSQCGRAGDPGAPLVCGTAVETRTDAVGSASAVLTVRVSLTGTAGTIDCRDVACYMATSFGGIPQLPLVFRPEPAAAG